MTGKSNNLSINKVFEYGESVTVPRKALESYLYSLWQEYKDIWLVQEEKDASEPDQNDLKYQPFLSFDGEFARARNYIGFIHHEDLRIEIYPKVFKNIQGICNELMHSHLFYWFSYCKKVKFPFNQAFLDRFDIEELPELIIYLFAKQIHEVVSTQPYSSYEQVQETLLTPRGKISFDRYVTQMSYCNYHLIDCDYEPFVFDNSLNRIIKYCTRLLLSKAINIETQRILNEIIFVLDEVDDQVCSVQQLQILRISPMYNDYEEVIQICRMILENQVYSHEDYEMRNWSLLFPMEMVFEEFIAGYVQKHFSDAFKVEVQKSDLYLHTSPNAFNIQHDILLTNRNTGEKIIVDTKYKPRWDLEKNDPKKGISQVDMYQMISYAYKRGTDKVLLIYPNASEELEDDFVFLINKGSKDETIKIKVVDVPFWSRDGYSSVEEELKLKLGETFSSEF
jgi:5-methylcytosine-specific restriction enzyme subunit McrC